MSKGYTPSKAVCASAIDQWHGESDVIVAGFGGAGACAAIDAARAGADVTLLEVASASGGTTALAGGQIYLGGGTPIQKACGFTDTPEDMEAYLTMAAGEGGDADKISVYSRDSLEHYQWLVDQGVEFNPEFYAGKHTNTPEYQSLTYSGNEKGYEESRRAAPAPRAHKPHAFWEDGGSNLMQKLTAAVLGAGVSVHYDSRVLTLVVDDERVVGVLCRQDGECAPCARGAVWCSAAAALS